MKRLSVFKLVFLMLGLGLLLYLLDRLGMENVMDRISQMGWGGLIIFVFPIVAQQVLFVYGWKFSFSGRSLSFPVLFQVNLLGEAFNYIMPGGQVGGEPLKALSLRNELGGVRALGSVVAAKTGKVIAMVLFIIVGMLLTMNQQYVSVELKRAVVVTIAIFSAVCSVFFYVQYRGLFGPVMRFIEKRSSWVSSRLKEKLQQFDAVDSELRGFYKGQRGKFAISLLFFLTGWVIGFLEIYMLLYFLGVAATLSTALFIETLSLIINAALFFVPAGIGTQEGGKVFIFNILGIDPATGLALALVRRLRELVWVALGLIVFAYRPMKMDRAASKMEGPVVLPHS